MLMITTAIARAENATSHTLDAQSSVPAYLVNAGISDELAVLETGGKFNEADQWLKERGTSSGAEELKALETERERLRRLKREYSATAEDILKKLKKEIPAATLKDIEQWRREGALQWLPVNGEVRFFRREPTNLLRFNKHAEAMQKSAKKHATAKGDPAGASKKFNLVPHLRKIIATAADKHTSLVLPITFQVRHIITVKPDVVPPGEMIRCWFPYPQEYRQQHEPVLGKCSPANAKISAPGSLMRTVYLEQPANTAGQPTTFTVEYKYETSAFYPSLGKPGKKRREDAGAEFLSEQPPHVVFSPEIRALAEDIVGSETRPLQKAELIWSWIDKNVRWAAEMEYGTMPNIVQKVSTCKRGDCGTQSLLFVTLCRVSGVPARWQSGWVTKPKSWNMHDWSEFYTQEFGWLPADPSVGRQKSKDPKVRDFMFGHLDAYRMIANLDWGKQFDPPKQFDRSDPVDNQRGEVEWSGGNLYYDDWSYEVEAKELQKR
jgi:transglutaminase-like putative cysteine protease